MVLKPERLKEQVKRNIERFPNDFMFQLTKNEWQELVAICDNLPENIKFSPALPYAFTQEGVAMLSGNDITFTGCCSGKYQYNESLCNNAKICIKVLGNIEGSRRIETENKSFDRRRGKFE